LTGPRVNTLGRKAVAHGAFGHDETNGSIPATPTAGMRAVAIQSVRVRQMEAFLISLSTVALAEIGDRTQLLSLVLATQFRKPLPLIAGIFVATVANHLAAGAVGIIVGRHITDAPAHHPRSPPPDANQPPYGPVV
jgi:hypothetical protein